jgi:preprotein translocase subunit SecA
MIDIMKKMFGTKNDRELKRLFGLVDRVNELEPSIASLDDNRLAAKTSEFRHSLDNGSSLDDILFEAFAVVREASGRKLKMRHFDVQILGGIALHEGKISEMKTGEGKTLVATLPVYLNAVGGKGVHVVTVNDYLAKRDAQWMGPLYHFLGLSVGVIQHDSSFLFDPEYRSSEKRLDFLRPCSRRESYYADITYGTNNEFGFDYLRDNMKYDLSEFSQRELNYAIVDEVDSILIDEARTPLIISGPSEDSTDKYYKINKIVPNMKTDEDFRIDEKLKSVTLTEKGSARVERSLGLTNLYDASNIELVHHVLQALRAHHLFKLDTDYVVKDGEVIIVDEFTGRLMPGRRWSDGLHQAIEAKEGVKIASENQTLATITFQNLFRMYNKLAGMTGTADTEASEFAEIYSLEVLVLPTNQKMLRIDNPDLVFKGQDGKYRAVIADIEGKHKTGQPTLVGTTSIEKSELLSSLLTKRKIKHNVLNAKFHEKEAEIVAQAGRYGAVTIATNMAGRGTDIVLGGNPEGRTAEFLKNIDSHTDEEYAVALEKSREVCSKERDQVIAAGGLHIIGTERHEARRIDNQLRGRSGRQGDPGSSRFYLSLDDDLMRIFGSDKINSLMDLLKMDEDLPIENKMVTRAIENAQKKVESHNFDIRKHLLQYDDVMNKQRTEIYSFRRDILIGESLKTRILEFSEDIADELLYAYCPEDRYDEWDIGGLATAIESSYGVKPSLEDYRTLDDLREKIITSFAAAYEKKEAESGVDAMRYLEKMVTLQVIDTQWKDHLLNIDHMKEGIGLRGYAQKDPVVEYKKEAFELFADMSDRIKSEVVMRLMRMQVVQEDDMPDIRPDARPDARPNVRKEQKNLVYNKQEGGDSPRQQFHREQKVGRNDPCPCGSGKKYKKCCGNK